MRIAIPPDTPSGPPLVQWKTNTTEGVMPMKKMMLLLVLVVIGLVIAKQFAGGEH